MEISIEEFDGIKVVILVGEIDAKTAPKVQQQVFNLTATDKKVLMDLSQVNYMSSAGLRMLLSLYRHTTAKDIKLLLVGLSEEIEDTMSVTGFLDFFATSKTRESGLIALKITREQY
ncbi:STAS domain-containing protein [Calothrix rhizosoleniae]|uniref:STAS domain-containing protein n=1 Tax=Calothrix rhizosoleniae TaxID=888997 RepID=UPI000B49F91D|nr:STAS domain-containing protein [Calothrix rhizosoleniae]